MKKILLILILISQSVLAQSGWVSVNMPLRNYLSVNFINSLTGYIIADDGFIEKTTDGGSSWIEINTGLAGNPNGEGYFTTSQLGAICSGSRVFTTSNGGLNWIFSYPPAILGAGLEKAKYLNNTTGFVCGVEYIPSANSSGVIGYLYKTTNTGKSWSTVFRGDWVNVSDYYVKSMDSITVLAGRMYQTKDGGGEWDTTTFNGAFSASSFTNPYADTIHACSSSKIIRSIDRGETWTTGYITTAFAHLSKVVFLNSKTGYCIGYEGTILFTSNGGDTWTKQRTNITLQINDIAFLNKDTVFAVSYNGIVFKTFNGGVTSVQQNNAEVPSNFTLHQNYPNPFNPATKINYELRTSSNISLNLYDTNGKLIKILESGYKQQGSYEVNFSAENLSSGVYYYSLYSNGNLMDTKKAVVLK